MSTYPTDYPITSHITDSLQLYEGTRTDGGYYRIKANANFNSSGGMSYRYLLDGTINHRLLHVIGTANHTNYTNNLLKLWFEIPDSIVLSNFRMYGNHAAEEFTLKTASSLDDESGTVLMNVTNGASSSADMWSDNYSLINVSSRFFFLNITEWNSKQYFQLREVQFVGGGPSVPVPIALPSISLLGDNPYYIDRGIAYAESGYIAESTTYGDITNDVSITNNIDSSTVGTYEVIYSVTDGDGNRKSVTRTVIVEQAGFTELETYTLGIYFTVDNGMPIMISNTYIKSNFGVAYTSNNAGRSVVGIHRIWVEKGTGSSGLIYTSPIIELWVFYSHKADSSEEISYESRKMNYDLQLNEWTYTSETTTGTIRSTGLTTSQDINLKSIYSNMPQVPMFSKYQAKKLSSLVQLKEECITDVTIGGLTYNADNIIILELWYDMSTSILEYVDCIGHIEIILDSDESIEYKTLYLSYNNDTKLWVIPSNRDMINSTLPDNKITEIEKVYPDPDRVSQDYVANPIYNDTFISFYTKPIGVSIHNEGIRYLDNSFQTTAMPPTGTIIMYACEDTPSGWIDCDGSLISKDEAEMIDLFNIIGYTYGGNGQTSFRIPDLNGRFPMGSDSTLATNDMYWDPDKKQGGNDIIQPSQFVHQHNATPNGLGYITDQNIEYNYNTAYGNGSWRYNPSGMYRGTVNVTEYNTDTVNSSQSYYPQYTKVRFLIKI
jgi:hypothetical protein